MNIIDLVPRALIYFLHLEGGQWFETGCFILRTARLLLFVPQGRTVIWNRVLYTKDRALILFLYLKGGQWFETGYFILRTGRLPIFWETAECAKKLWCFFFKKAKKTGNKLVVIESFMTRAISQVIVEKILRQHHSSEGIKCLFTWTS